MVLYIFLEQPFTVFWKKKEISFKESRQKKKPWKSVFLYKKINRVKNDKNIFEIPSIILLQTKKKPGWENSKWYLYDFGFPTQLFSTFSQNHIFVILYPIFIHFTLTKKPYKINRIKHKMRNFLRILDHTQHRFHPISSQKNRDRYCVSKWWQCTIDNIDGIFCFQFQELFFTQQKRW